MHFVCIYSLEHLQVQEESPNIKYPKLGNFRVEMAVGRPE